MKNNGREKKTYKIVKESEKLSPNKSAVEWKYEKSWMNTGGCVLNRAVKLWILSLSEPRNLGSRYGYFSMNNKICAWCDTNKITLEKRKVFMSWWLSRVTFCGLNYICVSRISIFISMGTSGAGSSWRRFSGLGWLWVQSRQAVPVQQLLFWCKFFPKLLLTD